MPSHRQHQGMCQTAVATIAGNERARHSHRLRAQQAARCTTAKAVSVEHTNSQKLLGQAPKQRELSVSCRHCPLPVLSTLEMRRHAHRTQVTQSVTASRRPWSKGLGSRPAAVQSAATGCCAVRGSMLYQASASHHATTTEDGGSRGLFACVEGVRHMGLSEPRAHLAAACSAPCSASGASPREAIVDKSYSMNVIARTWTDT